MVLCCQSWLARRRTTRSLCLVDVAAVVVLEVQVVASEANPGQWAGLRPLAPRPNRRALACWNTVDSEILVSKLADGDKLSRRLWVAAAEAAGEPGSASQAGELRLGESGQQQLGLHSFAANGFVVTVEAFGQHFGAPLVASSKRLVCRRRSLVVAFAEMLVVVMVAGLVGQLIVGLAGSSCPAAVGYRNARNP